MQNHDHCPRQAGQGPVEGREKKEGEKVRHLGDITRIHNAPFVDCITFGSPCQDLSIAGRRAGLAGERSGLFMEAVRIIKEMREQSGGVYPTFAIWENVPGAFSSNRGRDFQAVLEELASAAEAGGVLLFLNLQKASGAKRDTLKEINGALRGEPLMLNFGECPSEERESRLSWILEDNVPEKYYLSIRACEGILSRASRRGKALPEILHTALLDMIEWWKERGHTL